MCTGVQVREARRLLGWSTEHLASLCDVPASMIRVFEATGRVVKPSPGQPALDRLAVVRSVLQAAGVVFLAGEEPGVYLRRPKT